MICSNVKYHDQISNKGGWHHLFKYPSFSASHIHSNSKSFQFPFQTLPGPLPNTQTYTSEFPMIPNSKEFLKTCSIFFWILESLIRNLSVQPGANQRERGHAGKGENNMLTVALIFTWIRFLLLGVHASFTTILIGVQLFSTRLACWGRVQVAT